MIAFFKWTVHVGRHIQFKVWQPVFNRSCWLETYDSTWLLLFLLYFICCYCQSENNVHWLDQIAETRNTTSLLSSRLHMPCFTTETSECHALAVTAPPSIFRDLAVPHFRPVPFRILDRSSVPFRETANRSLKRGFCVAEQNHGCSC